MRALLVDDSPSALANLTRIVESASDMVCFGHLDPETALEAARADAFDIALVDYDMPALNGIDLIRRLRAIPRYAEMPILMVTANASESVRIAALEAGATDFLPKSADAAEIKVRLRNMIQLAVAFRKLNDQASGLAHAVESATRTLLEREEEMIFRLSLAVEYRDNDTGGHTLRVALYSRIIAENLGLPAATCRSIYLAAPLHDVGKVAIPDAILLKPGRLDPDEFAVIKGHSTIGERILGGSTCALITLAAEIAGQHHERWDGTGYPNGLAGRLIPLAARIVAIADVFDALTSERPYKTAMSIEAAFAYIESERGRHFDPTCVDAFLTAREAVLAVRQNAALSQIVTPVMPRPPRPRSAAAKPLAPPPGRVGTAAELRSA